MRTSILKSFVGHRSASRFATAAATALLTLMTSTAANAQVAQSPLYLGAGNVPGNLLLVPSVEWPTINSVANLGAYAEANEYKGYFNPNKCYRYQYDATEANRHFYPNSNAVNHRCAAVGINGEWSGNWLNWAATQTIDPFRSVLTGGYRVRDTATETWLEKARHDGQGGTNIFPNRRIPASGDNSTLVSGATPAVWNNLSTRIEGLGNKMRFTRSGDLGSAPVAYNPASVPDGNTVYEVSIRVKVCVSGHLEANCQQYSSAAKPEGLIQQYANDLRIGLFGYLNHHDTQRDGGVLRARQKFVGPQMQVPGQSGTSANPNVEWDATTGVLITNPDPTDAANTASAFSITIGNSGAINYLNKFGQLTTNDHKQFDPVSELYYSALRYMKNQGNVSEYTSMSGASAAEKAQYADGFPVITSWNDPIQYACQKNVILGIGDVYTHRDKNLPGSTYTNDEPTKPSAVSNDSSVNVITWTNRVGSLQGLGNIGNDDSWSGRNNSAYLAGLAYYANTTDIRTDIAGRQTVSTHWVDVLEAQSLEAPVENQYYLATKFGGFEVPDGFDASTFAGPLPLEWYHTNGETITSFGPNANPAGFSFERPDNYYLAGGADAMIASLQTAFANIAEDLRSSASSVASNSTRVDSDTAVFQASFDSARWSGELKAFRIGTDGVLAPTASWSAAAKLDALTEANITTRKIFSVTPPVASGGGFLTTTGINFQWASLNAAQQTAIRKQPGALPAVDATTGQNRLNYLRGNRTLEQPSGAFRTRDSRLGDIVNSDPQFVHRQDFGYDLLAESGAFSGTVASAYRTFRASTAYQNRTPMVIVGANDGMLHGFDASLGANGGRELFAFVPHAAYANLFELTLPGYVHRYYVDGPTRIADAYFGSAWKTIAVGVTGAGGASVFALDITDPSNMTSSSVLWEFSHPNLGNTLGQPAVTPLPNGAFGVVVTSGYRGAVGGTIWILNPQNGAIIREFSLPAARDLGTPLLADLNGDRVADRLYVGDGIGQLYRFDLTGSNPAAWAPPAGLVSAGNPVPLFIARDAANNPQAITAPPTSAFNEDGEHMVFFGTGSFYKVNDNIIPASPNVDSFYGIIDRGTALVGRGTLREQEILSEQFAGGLPVRAVSANVLTAGQNGWYLDLLWKASRGGPGAKGERIVSRAIVRGDRVIVTTLIPDPDPCSPGGRSWLMELNAFNGGRLSYTVFDVNADGAFDSSDYISIVDPVTGQTIQVPVSGLNPDIGIADTPAILSLQNMEGKVLSGSTGVLLRVTERASVDIGRQSWREVR